MVLGVKMIVSILFFAAVMIAGQMKICNLQKPVKELECLEPGDQFITWKGISRIYLIVSIGFLSILMLIIHLPGNLNNATSIIAMVGVLILIIFLFVLSILYDRVYVRMGKREISWRTLKGKGHKRNYEELTSYTMSGNGDIKIFQGDSCILHFMAPEQRAAIREILKNHKVKPKIGCDSEQTIIKMGMGYIIFDAVCILLFIVFFFCSAYYGVISGVFFFSLCTIAGIFHFFARKERRIIISKHAIMERRLLKKQKEIQFSKVAFLSVKSKQNSEVIVIHGNTGITIEIPRYYQNVELFERIAEKQHWKWKK